MVINLRELDDACRVYIRPTLEMAMLNGAGVVDVEGGEPK